MNIITTKALVPVQSFIPSPTCIHNATRSLDLSPEPYRYEVAFKVYDVEESGEIYGPDGKELFNTADGEFIDFYA